jgi:hypothetical protein
MAYLRLLTNALVAGTIGAAILGQLILFVNPTLPLSTAVVLALGWRLLVTAGLVLAAGFYVVSLGRYLLTRRSPGWLSLRLLAWMTTLLAIVGATLMWLNLEAFDTALPPDTVRRMTAAVAVLATGAMVLLVIALVHYSFGRRGSRVGGSLYGIAVIAVLLLPLVARGPAVPVRPMATAVAVDVAVRDAPAGRVWLVLLDGASLDYISPAAARGRLPNLGRLLDGGASLTLSTIEPQQAEPVWAAVATGRYPPGNGVPSGTVYVLRHQLVLDVLPRYVFADALPRLGLLPSRPRERGAIRAPALWRIIDAAGLGAGIAGWPLARPYLSATSFVLPTPAAAPRATPSRTAVQRDQTLWTRFEEAMNGRAPLLCAIRYSTLADAGIDAHAPADDEQRAVVDDTYEYFDAEVGRILTRLDQNDLLLVMSGYRLESTSPIDRLRRRLLDDAGLAAEANRSDGFLLAHGRLVVPGRKPPGAIVDVLPTLLYYLGLPVARDLDGAPRTDLFQASFTTARPVAFIRSYDADPDGDLDAAPGS